MQDRVSTTPGRMLITPENGQPAFYATIEMADNPTVVGTPLNKASLLTDATAALFGLGPNAVPDDVLEKARSLITAAQNTANTAMSKFNLSKIGTADVSGMTANNTGSITLSGRIRNYAEILLIFLDGDVSSRNESLSIEFTNLTPMLTLPPTVGSGTEYRILMTARSSGGVGFAHLTVPYNNANFAAFYGESQYVFANETFSRDDMAGLLYLPSSNTMKFSVLGTGTFTSGTIDVYGREF